MDEAIESEDSPALNIKQELVLRVTEDLCRKVSSPERHGPRITRHNPISRMVHDAIQQRVYVGLEQGEVVFWDLLRSKGKQFDALYTRHSSQKLVGKHAGCVTSLCCVQTTAHCTVPLIATGSADRCIKIWDPRKGNTVAPSRLVQTIYRHTGTVTSLTTCGDHLISGSTDRTVRLWRSVGGGKALVYPPLEQVRILTEMPAWVVSVTLASGQLKPGDDALYICDIDANIRRLPVSLGLDLESCTTKLSIGNCADSLVNQQQDRGLITATACLQHSLLATISWDYHLRIYNAESSGPITGPIVAGNEHHVAFTAVVYDAKSCQLLTTDQHGFLSLYRVTDGALMATKRVSKGPLVALQKCADNVFLVANASSISFWQIQREVPYNLIRGSHSDAVISLYSCSGGLGRIAGERDFRIFSASFDGSMRLWHPVSLTCLQVYKGNLSEISCMTFFEGWNTLISGHAAGEVALWNVATGTHKVIGTSTSRFEHVSQDFAFCSIVTDTFTLIYSAYQVSVDNHGSSPNLSPSRTTVSERVIYNSGRIAYLKPFEHLSNSVLAMHGIQDLYRL